MRQTQIVWVVVALTLAFLPSVPAIRAAETSEVDRNSNNSGESFDPNANVSLRVPFHLSENLSLGAVTEASGGEESEESELNRKLTNPVSDIWSIESQFNNFELNNGQWNNNWNFQPVPLGLFSVVSRPPCVR